MNFKKYLDAFVNYVKSVFDGRVVLPCITGSILFFIAQDMDTIKALWSGLGIVFIICGFATLIRRVLCPHVDLSEVYKKAVETSYGAAAVYVSMIVIMSVSMGVVLSWMN